MQFVFMPTVLPSLYLCFIVMSIFRCVCFRMLVSVILQQQMPLLSVPLPHTLLYTQELVTLQSRISAHVRTHILFDTTCVHPFHRSFLVRNHFVASRCASLVFCRVMNAFANGLIVFAIEDQLNVYRAFADVIQDLV